MTDLTQVTTPTVADIAAWYELKERLSAMTATEALMRRRLADHFFPTPTEGSKENKVPLNDGTGAVLQMDHKINRTVLEPELDAYKEAVKNPDANLPKLALNKLIKWKPELVKAEYNKLTAEEQKVCDTFLNVKPGMPDLKVVIPKRGA